MNHKYRQEVIAALIHSFEKGLTIKLACDFAGITPKTYYKYMGFKPFAHLMNKTRAQYALKLLPLVEEKDPWKLMKALYRGEYMDTPDTAIQINIDRPLNAVPTAKLLEALNLKPDQKEIEENLDLEIVEFKHDDELRAEENQRSDSD